MTVVKRVGPLPDGHPFKGTHIYFRRPPLSVLAQNSKGLSKEELDNEPEFNSPKEKMLSQEEKDSPSQEIIGSIQRLVVMEDKEGRRLESFEVTQPLTSTTNSGTPPTNKES